jgi:hypothetical protein
VYNGFCSGRFYTVGGTVGGTKAIKTAYKPFVKNNVKTQEILDIPAIGSKCSI